MKADRPFGLRVLACVLLLTAVGVLAFWVHWFVGGNFLLAGDECFRVFENSFPFPDTVMAVLLFLAASSLWRGAESGVGLCLFCAGMAVQLASLDLLYHATHGGFDDLQAPETYSRAYIIVHCYGLSAAMVAYVWRRRHQLITPAIDPQAVKMRFPVGMITVCLLNGAFSILTALHWTLYFFRDAPAVVSCAEDFHDAFWVSDVFTVLFTGLTVVGILARRSWALVWGLAACGGITFGACIWAAFAITNPELIEGRVTTYFIFVAFLLTGTVSISSFLWTRRGWFLSLD